MDKTYLNEILSRFDREFESLMVPFTLKEVVTTTIALPEAENFEMAPAVDDAAVKLQKITDMAVEISAERYLPNYNPEICLANLLNFILSDETEFNDNDNFFELLNQERGIALTEALSDFDFFLDNPYKKKAEKILSKLEARKNK